MALRTRVALAVLGVALVLLAVLALAYAGAPAVTTLEQYRPAPTLFAPPVEGGGPP